MKTKIFSRSKRDLFDFNDNMFHKEIKYNFRIKIKKKLVKY